MYLEYDWYHSKAILCKISINSLQFCQRFGPGAAEDFIVIVSRCRTHIIGEGCCIVLVPHTRFVSKELGTPPSLDRQWPWLWQQPSDIYVVWGNNPESSDHIFYHRNITSYFPWKQQILGSPKLLVADTLPRYHYRESEITIPVQG